MKAIRRYLQQQIIAIAADFGLWKIVSVIEKIVVMEKLVVNEKIIVIDKVVVM